MGRKGVDLGMGVDGELGLDGVGAGEGGDGEVALGDGQGVMTDTGSGGGEDEAEAGLIRGGAAVGGVVNLEDEVTAGGNEFGVAWGEKVGIGAGEVGGDDLIESGKALQRLALGGEEHAGRLVAEPFRTRGANEDDGVMDVGAALGADFEGGDPAVRGEAGGHDHMLIIDFAGGGNGKGGGHGEDGLGRGDAPAFGPVAGRGDGAARGSAGVGPVSEGGDFGGGEAGIVGKLARFGGGKPGGHGVAEDGVADGAGVGAGLLVGEQGHGRGLTGAMAGLAVAFENWEHVLIEQGDGGEHR